MRPQRLGIAHPLEVLADRAVAHGALIGIETALGAALGERIDGGVGGGNA